MKQTANSKQQIAKSIAVACYLLFVICFPLRPVEAAEGATLQFSPSSGTFFLGSTFNMSLTLNTGSYAINAVEVAVRFPADKIQVANPSIGDSFISIWVTPPQYSNTEGTLVFRGGVPTPGITISNGVISTATFRARALGEVELSYEATSQVLANDGRGTNVLRTRGVARFTIIMPLPEGPEVFSPTHADPNVWYRFPDPSFFWKKSEGADGFSYALSQDPFETPDEVSEGDNTSASFANVADGVWYFHLRAHAGNTWGGVTHYVFRIDRTPPASFNPQAKPDGPYTPGAQPTITFFTTDNASGVDHYEMRTVRISGQGEEGTAVSFFTEEVSPYTFPVNERGSYQMVVRVFDRAGNTKDATLKVELVEEPPRRFTREGIRLFGVLIRWWWPYLFLGLLLLIVLLAVWLVRRAHREHSEKLQKDLADTEEKLLHEYQAMYERVKQYRTQSAQDESGLPPPPPQ